MLLLLLPSTSAVCRSNTKTVQIAYLRTSHRIDFLWFFLALWMDILALLTACAVLARTISSCLDNMTGGWARILILGEWRTFAYLPRNLFIRKFLPHHSLSQDETHRPTRCGPT